MVNVVIIGNDKILFYNKVVSVQGVASIRCCQYKVLLLCLNDTCFVDVVSQKVPWA